MSLVVAERTRRSLDEICTFEYGSSLPERARRPGEIAVFGSSGPTGWHDRALVEGPVIIVGRKGSAGAVHWSNESCWPIDTAYFVRPTAQVDQRWLFHALRFLDLPALEASTAIPSLSREHAYKLELSVPPIADQRRIAESLDMGMAEMAAARAGLTRQREEAGALAKSAVEAAFGGRAIATERDPIANGPDWRPLTEVARIESGHTPSRKQQDWWGGDVPWVALPDIRALDGLEAHDTGEKTNALGLANSSARLLPAGTVVLSRTASVGFVTVMGKPMATSQDFVNWVPGPDLRSWYLAHALVAARSYVLGLAEGAIHKTIYMPTLKGLRVRLPKLPDQDAILARVAEAQARLTPVFAALDRQAKALDALGPSLLSAAFKGQL